MSIEYRYRKQIIAGVLIILVVASVICYYFWPKKQSGKKVKAEERREEVVLKKEETEKKEEVLFLVDVKGAVNQPGTYEIAEGKRVKDAIALAGGLREDASTTVLNLSKKVTDEMVIIVYTASEVENFQATKEKEKETLEICHSEEIPNDACIDGENEVMLEGKINLNTSSKEELMTVTGIGESRAEDIIKYREEHGPFEKIEDIMNVSGIGESLFAKIKETITV